ncbi:MAG: hypothetical protein A2015_06915 [Spirochaetes bacterium GWF1_31_7]|nr:MAG: hypothetical protein A2Y30_09545 [Spirochaetes bacterium GWE1_32_154]OHD46561.1 MAG: hypothetical protein A2015_06915 [Spirochaetes bacterium GWF1_31_7]OHD49370.1 MAG: hypothetical protein A2Y29_03910 [Spirochaetes bacterium GWE2_31_10]OHD80325.1 MAG: hypothetical protein A2355_12995 [Spirochaetes bacterium RIFOXYB1_FULL_32_8]
MNVLTVLADGCEESEMVTVVDILRRAQISVTLASLKNKIVIGGHDISIVSDLLVSEVDLDLYDGIFLPGGGTGVENIIADSKVLSIVKKFYNDKKWIIAICAAPSILEKIGIMDNKSFTIYPSMKDAVIHGYYKEDKVVVDGTVITSRGMGTSIDLGLKLVEIFRNKELSDKIKKSIVYSC